MTTVHEKEEFFKLAKEKYGSKIAVNRISFREGDLEKYNEHMKTDFTLEDFYNYGEHAWVINSNKCPECDMDLGGLFGMFTWGIVHGEGRCDNCGTAFRLYHYMKENTKPVELLSLIGF